MATHKKDRPKKDRAARLGDALRENLKRRKAKARALAADSPADRSAAAGADEAEIPEEPRTSRNGAAKAR